MIKSKPKTETITVKDDKELEITPKKVNVIEAKVVIVDEAYQEQ